MKNLLFTLTACALCATVVSAAPAKTKTAPGKVAKKSPAKVEAKPVVAPAKIAQATPGLIKPEEMPGFFPDVPRDHWAFAAVQRLAATGIVNGYPAATAATSPAMAAKPNDAKLENTPQRLAVAPTSVGEKVASPT